MKLMQILMAYGANSACAPVAIFETREDALAIITPILGEPTEVNYGELKWKSAYADHDTYEKDPVKRTEIWLSNQKAEEEWAAKMEQLFSEYYDGCGGCNIILEPIAVGTLKNFIWDLD